VVFFLSYLIRTAVDFVESKYMVQWTIKENLHPAGFEMLYLIELIFYEAMPLLFMFELHYKGYEAFESARCMYDIEHIELYKDSMADNHEIFSLSDSVRLSESMLEEANLNDMKSSVELDKSLRYKGKNK